VSISEVLAPFRLGIIRQYTDGSALGVHYRSASCVYPGRVSGRGRKSWILDYDTFTLDTRESVDVRRCQARITLKKDEQPYSLSLGDMSRGYKATHISISELSQAVIEL
jgi:hypothetical protein